MFELARSTKTVMGIDHCHEDIELALQLRKGLAVPYSFAREGELSSEAVAKASGTIAMLNTHHRLDIGKKNKHLSPTNLFNSFGSSRTSVS